MQGLVKENLFFYDIVEKEAVDSIIVGGEPTFVEKRIRTFINLGPGNVLRGIQFSKNLLVLLMNDWHEDKVLVPTWEKGRQVEKPERRMVNTEIPIEGEEAVKAFYKQFDPSYIEE